MNLRLYMYILFTLIFGIASAQESNKALTDTLESFNETKVVNTQIRPGVDTGLFPADYGLTKSSSPLNLPLHTYPNLYDYNKVFPRIGNLSGYVSSESFPGLMGVESMALSYTLQGERLSFTPRFYANKYGYFGGLTSNYGIGGTLSFKINDKWSVTAFGTYYTNAWASNPAVMSNIQSSRYGAYSTWNINNNWGLNVGAQRVYNYAMNQWQTIPILMPTYRVDGKDVIGIDLGGLLYELVDWKRQKSSPSYHNPTIGPPERPQITFGPRD